MFLYAYNVNIVLDDRSYKLKELVYSTKLYSTETQKPNYDYVALQIYIYIYIYIYICNIGYNLF